MNRPTFALAAILFMPAPLFAQQQPFKLGTFEDAGETYLGLVLDDTRVVNLRQANNALPGVKPTIPNDMTDLIVQYESLRPRLYAIANAASGADAPYIRDVDAVTIRPPLMPNIIYNAASNYSRHAAEMARRTAAGRGGATPPPEDTPVPDPIPGIWEREAGDTRQNPYIFLKQSSTVIADGEAIRVPPQREELDWECELAAVVGQPASRVSAADAEDYIFGYTLENDVSDRGGRADRRMGTDWFLQKNHDTFGPLGPFIVPKEFVSDPHDLTQTLTLSGQVMQDSNTGFMTHNTFEMMQYISSIATMQPGDVFAMGSPSGVGTARETPVYMKHGDTAVCMIAEIGTLTNPVVDPTR
jgi:2-keto-4-pentenoate hydratase/2-oxohepta-3-ene-1,7-dioic acid hydratase in catechol pathway